MYSEDKVKNFYKNYRDSLSRQRETAVQGLDQQRRNDFTTIMSNANTAGAMYSNFPQRDKIKYDTGTYTPSLVKMQQSYQTGLDSLRNNIVNYQNSIKSIQDAINELNKA